VIYTRWHAPLLFIHFAIRVEGVGGITHTQWVVSNRSRLPYSTCSHARISAFLRSAIQEPWTRPSSKFKLRGTYFPTLIPSKLFPDLGEGPPNTYKDILPCRSPHLPRFSERSSFFTLVSMAWLAELEYFMWGTISSIQLRPWFAPSVRDALYSAIHWALEDLWC
jgi:hypothetical protein